MIQKLSAIASVCACFILEPEDEWPIEQGLWQRLETLCTTWLVVVVGEIPSLPASGKYENLCARFSGQIIYAALTDNPYEKALQAVQKTASHLWLMDASSIIQMPALFRFGALQDSYFIAQGFDDKELHWRRRLIATQHSWQFNLSSQQWEATSHTPDTEYLKQIKIKLHEPELQRNLKAKKRKSFLLQQLRNSTPSSTECKEIAQCYEVLSDTENAANWYHRGAGMATDGDSIQSYCSYRYWRLIQELTNVSNTGEWQQRWLDLFEAWPDRAEPLYHLAQLYVESGNWQKAYSIVQIALGITPATDGMPVESWIYEYGLSFQASQCAHALKDDQGVLKHSVAALNNRYLSQQAGEQLRRWQTEAYQSIHNYLPISRDEKNHFVIIVPFRNCAPFLQSCIDSLRQQQYRNFEVIFIDDSSDDGGLQGCVLTDIPNYTILSREISQGALSNQIDVLRHHTDPSDIAVFLDGDDQLADGTVLEYLNTIYNQTGCWLSYGQFSFDDTTSRGYARPMLESESISSLFLNGGFRFPIHLRTHRAGLINELLRQDPQLECMHGKDGKFVQSASDVAHMRAMMLLTPQDKIRFIPKVLYRYNTRNPNSHFKTKKRTGQFKEFINIARKMELDVADRWSPFVLSRQQKTRLLLIMLPGANLDIVTQAMQQKELPHLQSISPAEGITQLKTQAGQGNAPFTRAILCEQQIRDYADFSRYIPRPHAYSELGFDRPHMRTSLIFGSHHILNGKFYAALGTGEVNFLPMKGLTLINQWMCHGKVSPTQIYPEPLREAISADQRFDVYDPSLERYSIAKAEDARQIFETLSQRLKLKLEVYLRLLNRGDWDCLALGFDELHDMGHLLWHFWDPAHPLYQSADASLRNRFKAIYEEVDAAVGDVLACAGPVPTVLLGGTGMNIMGSLNSYLDLMLRVFESAYTGKEISKSTHKRNRLFYAQYSDPACGGIHFNLKGREPNGRLSESRYDDVCNFLIRCFREISHLETRRPVVSEMIKSRARLQLKSDSLYPDLLCVWEPGSAYGAIHSERLGRIDLKPNPGNVLDFRTGDHNGIAWAAMNDQARAYFPDGTLPAPHEFGHYFREIVENFPALSEQQTHTSK